MEDPDRGVANAIFIGKPDMAIGRIKREMRREARRSAIVALLKSQLACPESRAATEGEPHHR
jgi:hypothetical protein